LVRFTRRQVERSNQFRRWQEAQTGATPTTENTMANSTAVYANHPNIGPALLALEQRVTAAEAA
jgi:hypothetical protein